MRIMHRTVSQAENAGSIPVTRSGHRRRPDPMLGFEHQRDRPTRLVGGHSERVSTIRNVPTYPTVGNDSQHTS